MSSEMTDEPKLNIHVVEGVEGICVYINDYRVIGPKPWGGGTTIIQRDIAISDIPAIEKLITSQKAIWEKEAEIRGMYKAKSRVLRRTEIPKDARNPTRDHIVILGEEIADIIDQDIADLAQLSTEDVKDAS